MTDRDHRATVPVAGRLEIGGVEWRRHGSILEPLVPPHRVGAVDRNAVREALAGSDALLARWTEDWDGPRGPWWWVCCDDPGYTVERLSSRRGRRDVRRGLRQTTVRRLTDAEVAGIADDGLTGTERATRANRLDRADSADHAGWPGAAGRIARAGSGDARLEYWAAFAGDAMAAIASCRVFSDAVMVVSSASDPRRHAACPNNALFYALTRHYLAGGSAEYVTNGTRTIHHTSRINRMLVRMGFRQVYGRLQVELSPRARIVDAARAGTVARWLRFHRWSPRRSAELEAFSRLMEIYRAQ